MLVIFLYSAQATVELFTLSPDGLVDITNYNSHGGQEKMDDGHRE